MKKVFLESRGILQEMLGHPFSLNYDDKVTLKKLLRTSSTESNIFGLAEK
jgi:hypothetical protein